MSLRLERTIALLSDELPVDEFVVTEHESEVAELRLGFGPPIARQFTHRHLDIALFRDLRQGRGQARLRISGAVQDPQPFLADAVRQAAQALGPPWLLPAPAAPARVQIADPAIIANDLSAIADTVRERLGTAATLPERAGPSSTSKATVQTAAI
ncbi:MAG: hypothetical protein AAGC55_23015, partial [Myxococcota bacterium]